MPTPSAVAIRSGIESVSFGELKSRVSARADALKKAQHPLVVLEIRNTVDDVITALACLDVGVPLALFDAHLSSSEKERKLALLPPGFSWSSQQAFTGSPSLALHPQARLVLFTSGSSGGAKAVQLSEANIRANTCAVIASLEFEQVPRQQLFLPLFYSFGLLGQLLPALELGKETILHADFASFFRSALAAPLEGMISGVPPHFETLLQTLPGPHLGVTHVVSAGARLSVELRRRLIAAFPNAVIYNNYGQTEASPRILSYSSRDPRFLADYAGKAVGDWELRTTPEGELRARGPQVMLGYIDSARDHEALKGGWLCTGDQAEVTSDGLVRILGRADDLIKVAGERMSLGELEAMYKEALGHDRVVALARPHPLRGTAVILVVAGSSLSVDEIRKLLEPRCSAQRLPSEVVSVDEIPRLGNGKVDRQSLTQRLAR